MTAQQNPSIAQLFDLTGKVAIVTGGAMGIGQGIALRQGIEYQPQGPLLLLPGSRSGDDERRSWWEDHQHCLNQVLFRLHPRSDGLSPRPPLSLYTFE